RWCLCVLQSVLLGTHCHNLLQELGNLLCAALTSTSTPQSASASPIVLPASYAGEPAGCGGFLLQVSLYIKVQLQKFSTVHTKVAFLISLLSVPDMGSRRDSTFIVPHLIMPSMPALSSPHILPSVPFNITL
uniref:Uncharacterized protein n=1 Tax=Cyprinus carpio TaxID=7962 RepID=A0A8C1T9G8_CYPCA